MTLARTELQKDFDVILNQDISSLDDLILWISQCDQLDAKLGQDYAWKYIHQTTNTADEIAKQEYSDFLQKVYPEWIIISDQIGRKLIANEYISLLPKEYNNYIRGIRHAVELFREQNVVLLSQEKEFASKFADIVGSQTVTYKGDVLTMKQAEERLKSSDRAVRKDIFELMEERRHQDVDQLDIVMSSLISIRTQIAHNCGFKNYTDYSFSFRYDYNKVQVNQFHEAICKVITPIMESFSQERKKVLGLTQLKPYDYNVPLGEESESELFTTTDDMIDKLCLLLHDMDPEFEQFIRAMRQKNQLDLETRPNKAPGGYNYPLAGSDYSFIFMNAMRDHDGRFTRAHEAGHGLHHYLTRYFSVGYFRDCPMEICEIASMAMELFTMDDLGKIGLTDLQIQDSIYSKIIHDIGFLPYMSKIDLFQQRMYDNPEHNKNERTQERRRLNQIYSSSIRTFDTESWSPEYQMYLDSYRHRQMHLFEVPFYYIEYGIAQLASLQLYNQWIVDRSVATENYKKILSAGYIYSIPDTMALGGVQFDVSEERLQLLMKSVVEKYQKLGL